MALRNLFGEVALESTNLEARMEQGELLLEILVQLRIMNTHLAAISGERVTETEVEGEYHDS